MATILQGDFIESLPSKVYYRKMFESGTDYCFESDGKSKFKQERSKLNKYEKINSIEKRLVNPLCHVSFTSTGEDCDKQCHNLYYWLGNELFNNLKEDSFSDVIGILEDVSSALSGRDKCKCKFFKNIKKENFEKMKTVYDYCKDREQIENTLELHKKTCDSKFNEYLVKATGEYEKMYECTQGNTESYCKELKNHIPSCFEKKLSPLTCKIKDVTANEQGISQYNTTILDPNFVINVSVFSSSQIFLLLQRNLDEMDILELTEYTNEQRKSNLGRKQLNVAYHAA
ncbi:PIR Superfamily Protein [Plasmodium malariae]|uniref:PIR Superfamily Protein n=1 Tax=Plasmodium malariae TaxID=5858 RepID=A0A1A8X652_PLAMA|nr:PIR Superfamily Protein [Plasmodium malariae]